MVKRLIFTFFLACCFSVSSLWAQDSIPLPKDLTEEKELTFQTYFFKALSEKAIKNFAKAIQYLENCNQILPNDKAVFFEFSKNYLFLEKTLEAKEYIERALALDPNNVWMLTHLVDVYSKQRDFTRAIATQKQIIENHPDKKKPLVYLYLQNKQLSEALALLNEMEQERGLGRNLKQIKADLERRNDPKKTETVLQTLDGLIAAFQKEPSFSVLKQLLMLAEKEDQVAFLRFSKEGYDLFPAQAEAYLFYAKSLLYQKSYENALLILESGIDFVIDNRNLEITFYEHIAKAYIGLKNEEKANEFKVKAKKLKNK